MSLTACILMMQLALGLPQLRLTFEQSVHQEAKARYLIETLEQGQGALNQGYLGATYMVMANHTANPLSKLKYFKKGKGLLEQAISASPNNAELRMLRYAVQISVPGFLNYSSQQGADRAFLQASLKNMEDPALRNKISEVLKKGSE
jgi:hypothetical protein